MRAFARGRLLARSSGLDAPADLSPVLQQLGLEVVPWRFEGRVRRVILGGGLGIGRRPSGPTPSNRRCPPARTGGVLQVFGRRAGGRHRPNGAASIRSRPKAGMHRPWKANDSLWCEP